MTTHPFHHVLTMFRQAMPEDKPRKSRKWEVVRLNADRMQARTGGTVQEFEVVWAGPWANTWQTAEELGNDELPATYLCEP